MSATAAIICLTLAGIDGDSAKCDGETVRVIGLNAPESAARYSTCPTLEGRRREVIHGQRAKQAFRAAIAAAHTKELTRTGRDRYGRTLGVIRLDGVEWSRMAIQRGLAEPYVCPRGRCPRRSGWCS